MLNVISVKPNISEFERKIRMENFVNQLESSLDRKDYVKCEYDIETKVTTIYQK